MNGFLAFKVQTDGWRANPERVAPLVDGASSEMRSFAGGESLLLWGHAAGDIYCATRGTQSFLVLCGYITEVKSGPDFRSQSEAAELLLAAIEQDGSTAALSALVDRIHGSFSIFYRNGLKGLTLCISDRVATRPLWRLRGASGWAVSSHPLALALSLRSPRLDPGALGAFLLYGGPILPTKSLFQDIETLPPGSIVRWGEQGEPEESRWHRFRHQPDESLSLNDWVEFGSQCLLGVARRLVRHCKNPAIFFSGGVDSRISAAAMKAAGGNPLLVTLGDSTNLEVRVARRAAKVMGLRHQVILRDKHWYLRNLRKATCEAGGYYVWTHGHFSAAAARVSREAGVDSFLLGDCAEAFSKLFCSSDRAGNGLWTPEEFAAAFDTLRLPLYRPRNRVSTLALLRDDVRADVEETVRREIVERYHEVRDVSADPLIVGDHCFRWEAEAILPTFLMNLDLRSAAAERNLMLDRDVHDLLERLPSRFRNGMNLGALLIQRLDPRAAWVLNSNSLLPMVWPPAAHKMSRRIKPVLGRLRRLLRGTSHRTTGSWPEQSVLYATDPKWRACFEQILGGSQLFEDFLDRDAVKRCWQGFLAGDMRRAPDVEKLVCLGLVRQLLDSGMSTFVREESSRQSPDAPGIVG